MTLQMSASAWIDASLCLMAQQENVRSQLSVVVLCVQMGMSLMRRGVGPNCRNMQRQLAALKAQGGHGNDGALDVCVLREGGEEFPEELIIPILTYGCGGRAGSRGGGAMLWL